MTDNGGKRTSKQKPTVEGKKRSYIIRKRCPNCFCVTQYIYRTDRVEKKGRLRCSGCHNVW